MVEVISPGLSLIVTTFNARQFIPQFSIWVKGLTDCVDEIVVVDDHSVDGTYEALLEISEACPLISVYRLPANSGRPAIPRNIGLKKIKYSRVVFCDVDDVLPYQYLQFLGLNCKEDCIYSGVKLATLTPIIIRNWNVGVIKRKPINHWMFNYKNMLVLSGASAPAHFAKQIKFKNEPLEDWIYWREYVRHFGKHLKVLKCINVPVGYYQGMTLSPAKRVQVSRIRRHLPGATIVFYFLLSASLKLQELKLAFSFRFFSSQTT